MAVREFGHPIGWGSRDRSRIPWHQIRLTRLVFLMAFMRPDMIPDLESGDILGAELFPWGRRPSLKGAGRAPLAP